MAWRLGTVTTSVAVALGPVAGSMGRLVAPPVNSFFSDDVGESDGGDGFSITWLPFRRLLGTTVGSVSRHALD
jgi:hypothetical protein